MRFEGKRGLWWYGLLLVVNVGILYLMYRYRTQGTFILYLVAMIMIDYNMVPVIFNNYAIVDKKMLTVVYGLRKQEILIADILTIQPVNKVSISFCADTDGVFLVCKGGLKIQLSYKDNKAFVEALRNENRKMKVFY